MKLVPLIDIFDVEYGNQYDLNKMEELYIGGVNFVSRSSNNLGVVAKVKKTSKPYNSGLITVSLGGTYLLSSFVQHEEFYTAQNIKVLKPKFKMSLNEKIYYCLCISKNRFRYSSHGREVNKTLEQLQIPSFNEIPTWVYKSTLTKKPSSKPIYQNKCDLDVKKWKSFRYDELFIIKKGKRITNSQMNPGKIPCIRPIESNNGVYKYIDIKPNHEGNTITVSYNGSVGEAFYQPEPHFALDDINVLYPKFELNQFIAMFLITLIKQEKYRFNYGRKWKLERMKESIIKLPVDETNEPDWQFMEDYIKSLPYSSSIN